MFANVKVIGGDKASQSAAREASRAAKATAGRLFYVEVEHDSGGDLYLQIFDAASLPANGTAPTCVPQVIPTGMLGYKTFVTGRPFAVGIVAALSSTKDTLTVAGAVGWFDVHYA